MAIIDTLTTVEELALACGGVRGPAELHGLVTGFVCAGGDPESDAVEGLLDQLLEGVITDEAATADRVVDLALAIRDELDSDELGFTALLPDDDERLSERVAALARWCSGLLAGLLLGADENVRGGDVVRELLSDLGQIVELDDDVHEIESEERNFHEVTEFVRMAALTLRMELATSRGRADADSRADHSADDDDDDDDEA